MQKKLQKTKKNENAFRKTFEIWEGSPKIIDSEEMIRDKKNDEQNLIRFTSSTVHLLEEQSLILHVKSLTQPIYDENGDFLNMVSKVLFDFFEA